MTPSIEKKFNFDLDRNLAKGAVTIDAAKNPALLAALVDPQGVLPAIDTVITGGSLSIAPGKDISVGPAHVGFSADANAAIGIFTTPGTLRAALLKNEDLVSQVGDSLSFPEPAGSRFLMLRWGYDIAGTAAGTVALAPGAALGFSAHASRKGYYAIVHAVHPDANARAALTGLIAGWKLPSQVRGIGQLPPGAWLISEVDGSVGIKADVKFGYSYTWLRDAAGLGLKGDIGLKLQTGLSAAIGFNTSGKYAVALSRESMDPSSEKIRLRLFKLRVNNWNFAFNATSTVTPKAPLPDSFDDLVSAVVGTNHQQIMKLLGQVEDWTDPNTPLFGPFVNMADDAARRLIQSITGVADLTAGFNEVKGRILQMFQFWNRLPQTATQLIYSKLPDAAQIAKVAGMARRVAGLTPEGLRALIGQSLGDVPFLNSTDGKALEALAANGLFTALNNSGALAEIQKTAHEVSQLLDGGALQGLLTKLQAQINSRLDLKQIQKVVDQTSLASIDAWLRARLESFLEQKIAGPAGVDAIKKLRSGLATLLAKKDELYAKALQALRRKYEFSFQATYQNTAATSALLDATFDFSVPGSAAATGLSLALGGKFDELLASPLPGVHIQEGVLAYGIHKESHISLALPYFSTSGAHINDSLAQLTHVNENGGSLMYSVQATDLVTVKSDFSSALAISLGIPGGLPSVHVYSTDSSSYRYDLKTAAPQLTSADLARRFGPYIRAYFPTDFRPASPGSFEDWVGAIAGKSGRLGNALVSLDLSLPPSSLAAWLSAPASDADPKYKVMSFKLQKCFKQLLHDYFFSDVRHYRDVSGPTTAKAVLTFCSIAPFQDENPKSSHIYWDYRNRDLLSSMLSSADTAQNLLQLLETARLSIAAAGDPDGVLSYYADSQAGRILSDTLRGPLLAFLFPVEANMVEEARNAGRNMAKFRANRFANPQKARQDLARFGQKLTEDFNANLKTFAVDNALLPLGTLAYAEAVSALDPAAAMPVAAMLTLRILKDGAVPAGLDPASPADVLRLERVIHEGAYAAALK